MTPRFPHQSRRRYFLSTLLAIFCGYRLAGRADAAEPAELVVRQANIVTINSNQPRAQAFAVRDGRFVVVGDERAVNPFIGAGTRVLSLPGKTVVPGFIDAHAHPQPIYPEDSRWAAVDCRPEKVRTIEELVAALKRKAEMTAAGTWVLGSRYQETKLGRQPTRWDLDRASTNHPIIISHSSWEHGDKMEAYGEWRWDWMHPARSLLDLGIPLAGHSDSPVSAADPLLRVQDMVTRTSAEGKVYGAKQRISAEEALRVWTLGGAYASFEESSKGSIAVDKLADFVILSADPTQAKPAAIKDIALETTIIGGRVVFERK